MALDKGVLKGFALFASMTDAQVDLLASRATARRVAEGSAVFEQGEPATSFYLLLDGRLKVRQITADGQQIIVRIVNPGDLLGFACALSRPDYPGTATAAVDSVVAAWPSTNWNAFVEANPHLAMNAIRTIGQRLDEAHTRIREMSTQEVERRVAHTVLRLVDQAGKADAGGTRVDFPISRRDIAEMTGTTLHTVSRILSAWEAQGLVEGGRRKLVVRDAAKLAKLAEAPRD
ncbi:transcriptional regulator, Crp/Fnr family [Rhodomicrobium vannielii ATCC 17100]|uniref:Transcriptional regulator, Crp/Fnr family n=2 Tax=Rhodomicrobium vannielii TaxID=1069 RepID=E3HZB4_RHOVT|nr:Crp/Fnr family transcriptional regulator [Rhodomicrobium vannielii]ADP69860.1 transcriptional regulator, Crp/Fnr family [Rhodomicrobium vannielii ATCC 17100]